MSRQDMFGSVEKPMLSVLCNPQYWKDKERAMHRECSGRFIAENQAPSGSNPTVIGICTCPCHTRP